MYLMKSVGGRSAELYRAPIETPSQAPVLPDYVAEMPFLSKTQPSLKPLFIL